MTIPYINSYHFGKIIIDSQTYNTDIVIFPDHVKSNWWRVKGHSLTIEDLTDVIAATPQVLVIGSGAYSRMKVPTSIRKHLEAAGIKVIHQPTELACQTYNNLREVKKVVAALHLTC